MSISKQHPSIQKSLDSGPTFFEWANLDEVELESLIKGRQKSRPHNRYLKNQDFGRIVVTESGIPVPNDILEPLSYTDLKLHKKLFATLQEDDERPSPHLKLSSLQGSLIRPLLRHVDVLFTPQTATNATEVRQIICLHTMNHIFKTRDLVLKNNARISHAKSLNSALELRDQGFTRPKVLFLVPNRHSCYKIVQDLVSISKPSQQENKSKFVSTFTRDGLAVIDSSKPEDFVELFGGNNEDMFRIGLKFTKTSLKFFSHFNTSDIIIASPLGIRREIENGKGGAKNFGFLSSLEIVVVDQADALQMQNWAHVQFVFDYLNCIPEVDNGCDFSRVRKCYLDGFARHLRQTIITSQYITSDMSALFSQSLNVLGQLKVSPTHEGVLNNFISQTFIRLDTQSPTLDGDDRLKFFITVVLPLLQKGQYSEVGGLLIFVPTYLEFVRLSSHLRKLDVDYAALHEYSSLPDVSRARASFAGGAAKILIYTERIHHFRRYSLKGVKQIFMYKLPSNPRFYTELLTALDTSINNLSRNIDYPTARILFSRWDVLQLERVVGNSRIKIMVTGIENTFDFP